VTIDGWKPISYTWEPNGLQKTMTFESFTTHYNYHTDTRLLKSVINVDNTATTYTYDQLFRLKTAKDSCRNVTTTLDYNYGTPSTGGNYVRSITDYTQAVANANSNLTTITNKQFFDGLGRSIQTIKEDQGPTSNDDIIIKVSYDKQGRLQYQYEPKAAPGNNGAFYTSAITDYSTTAYEASPLNRPTSQTHTAWNYPTTTTYGANTTSINGYDPDELFKQTIIDADSKETITYTDTRGRTIATQMAGSGGSNPLTTLYNYDDKDRPIKIIPPGSTAGTTGLNFTYTYYGNDLVKFKKVPDVDSVEYRYNNRDLLISYQDGFLKDRSNYKWINTQYDDYGHAIKTGFGNAITNNQSGIPSIIATNILTESTYYTSGNHIDKLEKSYTRELKSDGSLGLTLESNFTYDDCGRLQIHKAHTLLSTATVDDRMHSYTYDGADNITIDSAKVQAFNAWTYADLTQTIDFAGRLLETKHRFQNGTNLGTKSIAKQTYNEKGLIDKLEVGYKSASGYLETSNYTYKGNQWLESMDGSLFDYTLYYNSTPLTAGQNTKNGNISEIKWGVLGGEEYAFGYTYDIYNRLENSYSKSITGGATNEYQTYYELDDRGNFINIQRRGLYPNGNTLTAGLIDDLDFTPVPGTNKIKTVEDNASSLLKPYGAKGSTEEFAYDSNGNVTKEPTKGIDSIYWNHLNLPRKIEFSNGGIIDFTYDADGNQLRKEVKQGSSVLEDRYYIGGAEYKDSQLVQVMHPYGRIARENACDQNQHIPGQLATDDTYFGDHIISDASVVPTGTTEFKAAQSVIMNEEFVVASGKVYEAHIEDCEEGEWVYEYSLKDHLGNSRIIFSDRDNLGSISADEIIEQSHTYPYSQSLTGSWNNTLKHDYNYKVLGSERHVDFGADIDMHAFRGRFLDHPVWLSPEPLAEEFSSYSSYAINGLNPISNIDPLGLNWYTNNETGKTTWFEGSDEKEGYTDQGALHVISGKNGYLVHYQNTLILAVTKNIGSEGDAVDLAFSNSREFDSSKDFSGAIGAMNYLWFGGNSNGFKYNKEGYAVSNTPLGGAPIDFGPAKLKSLVKFRGLAQGRLLSSLTHANFVRAFKGTGFKLSGHAIKRLKDIRTQNMGFNTLNDIKQIFNKGAFFKTRDGLVGKSYRGMEVIYNPKTKVIVTFRPAKVR